jgi:sporulation protein YpjB
MRWGWFGLIPVIWLLLFPFWNVDASRREVPKEAEEWSKIARRVEEWVSRGELLKAREELAVLANRFSRSDLSGKRLRVEAIHALSQVIIEMEQNLNRVRPDEEKLAISARRLVLAFDAASHPNQPLWRESYDPMRERVREVMEAINAKDRVKFQQAVNRLNAEYQMIRPALAVAKSPITLSRIDSIMAFLRRGGNWQELGQAAKQLNSLLYPLFYGSEKDVMAAVSGWDERAAWRSAFWVSSLTVLVLGYVSWRKYRETHKMFRAE